MASIYQLQKALDKQTGTKAVATLPWIQKNCFMENPKGDGQKFKPDFWPKQQEYIQFQDENRITLTLKARQEGFTWLNVYRMLKRCMERENFRVLVFSQAKKQAKEVIRRLYFVYDNLPEAVRMSNPLVGRRNTEILMFKNGSSITSFGTTKDAGRGFAASCVFIDEADSIPFARQLYAACKPTVDDGGELHIVFTVNGTDGLGRELWGRSEEEENSPIKRFFCAWFEHPGRDKEWYDRTLAGSLFPQDFKREYPTNPNEALAYSLEDALLFHNNESLHEKIILNENDWVSKRRKVVGIDAGITDDTFAYSEAVWHPMKEMPVISFTKNWVPVPGKPLDFDDIFNWIKRRLNKISVEKIVVDPLHIQTYLDNLKMFCPVEVIQQGNTRALGDTHFAKSVRAGNFNYVREGDWELFEDHLLSTKMKVTNDKVRFIKKAFKKKIDLTVASSMAVWKLFNDVDFAPLYSVESNNKEVTPVLTSVPGFSAGSMSYDVRGYFGQNYRGY
jgi:hypothetical protein